MKLIVFLVLILISCIQCTNPPHIRAAHQIMSSYSTKMESEGFSLVGSGGAMMVDIQEITLDFEICENREISEVRLLFIQKAEELIYQVNSNQNIQQYLHDKPFTSKNISLGISFCKLDGKFVHAPYIAYVFLIPEKNRIFYSIYDEGNDRLKTIYDESYEEALTIYNASKCSGSLR